MRQRRSIGVVAALLASATAASIAWAQSAPPAAPSAPPPVRAIVYPTRPVDPAGVERGRVLFTEQGCAACHGADTRGGSAPGLHRSAVVLNDVRGETIGALLAAGLPGAPNGHRFKLERSQVVDIADFLHSNMVVGTGSAGIIAKVPSILTGSASAGKAYFDKTCAACHSVTGDLAGIGGRLDPKALQQRWLSPRATKPITATVTLPEGKISGDVTALDEFSITVKTATGERVIPRNGDKPAVVITDPRAGHAAILRRISDDNIHDVTAYLVTVK